MSILISGMEMPSCCGECRFLSEYGDYPVCIITDEQRGYNFRIRELKMPHCPLVSVPDHGDLIDRDVLEKFRELVTADVPGGKLTREYVSMAAVRNIKTIIPASDESET